TEVACSHVSGLFTQSGWTAGPDGVREPRPHHSSGIDVPMKRQASLGCAGSTDCAITRHCSLARPRRRGDRMNRRTFITLLGGAAAAWPLAARAQQPGKLPTLGFLGSVSVPAAQGRWVAAFLQRLRELGWTEGRNFVIEYRWAEGSSDRAAEFASEFVRLKVDIIVTYATPIVLAAKRATSI